jgi:nucleoside-diphosphate-sugar epimerase
MSDSSKHTVLVIGAGGHGGTGTRVVDRLLAHDRNVRLLVRSRGAHVDRFVEQGVQVVTGDLMDRRSFSTPSTASTPSTSRIRSQQAPSPPRGTWRPCCAPKGCRHTWW